MRRIDRVLLVIAALIAVACGAPAGGLNPVAAEADLGRRGQIEQVYLDGRFTEAERLMAAYMADFPRDATGWTILGNVQQDLDNADGAERCYREALALQPAMVEPMVGMGVVSRMRGDLDGAVTWYEKALAIQPEYPQALSSLAVIHLKRSDPEAAVQVGERAHRLDPTDETIAANLAVSYHYVGDFERRDELTRKAIELGYRNGKTLQEIYRGELTVLGQ